MFMRVLKFVGVGEQKEEGYMRASINVTIIILKNR